MTRQLVWSYGEKGAWCSAMIAGMGTTISCWLGGWDNLVETLVLFMFLDFVLGFLASAKEQRVDSRTMFWGGINKVLVLALVAVGVRLDGILGLPEPLCRSAIGWFYLGREGISMVENSARLGFPWPDFVVQLLWQMKEQGEKQGATIVRKEGE